MLVKHLIRELSKFSPDSEAWMVSGWDEQRWETFRVLPRSDGGVEIHYPDPDCDDYENSNDTPLPYPDDYGETVII